VSAVAAPQLGKTPVGARDRSENDSDATRSLRFGNNDDLSPSLTRSSAVRQQSHRIALDFRTRRQAEPPTEKGRVSRPTVEVADIFRAQGKNFIDRHRTTFRFQQLKVMRAIMHCRTAALGGHVDVCPRCGSDRAISYNSCRNRHCPKCQSQARQRWIAARKQELLATRYFHVVFTLPHELHALVLQNQSELYNLLFRTAAETLIEIARDPKHLGA